MFDQATEAAGWVWDHGQTVAPGWAIAIVGLLLGCVAVLAAARRLMISLGSTATETANQLETIRADLRRCRDVFRRGDVDSP